MLKTLLKFGQYCESPGQTCSIYLLLMEIFFLKELCLTLGSVMLSEFPVVCILLLLRIKLNKYGGDFFLSILQKKHSFLNQHLERYCLSLA